jgi:pimeloyl-ACP methyl ester carboxylesterase
VQVEEGVALRGLSRPPRAPARPWILFYQGNSNDRQLGEGQQFLEALAQGDDLGLAVVAWRGYDGSPGKPSGANLLSDAEAIYRWARTSARGPVHLIGFSLGTLPAAYVAARDPAAPASVALLAPFTQIQMVHPRAFARSLLADRLDEVPDLAHLGSARPQVPALVLHGDADPVLPVEMGRAAAAAVGTSARLVVLPGAGHAELLGDARALRELRLHLGLPPGP